MITTGICHYSCSVLQLVDMIFAAPSLISYLQWQVLAGIYVQWTIIAFMGRIRSPNFLAGVLVALHILTALVIVYRPHEIIRTEMIVRQAQRSDSPAEMLEAASALARLAELLPWRVDLWEQAGRSAWNGSDTESSIHYLEQAEAARSLSPQGLLLLGDAYQVAGEQDAAIDTWTKAHSEGIATTELSLRLQDAYWTKQDYPETTRYLLELADAGPVEVELRYRLGMLLAAQEPETALPHLAQITDSQTDLSEPAAELVSAIRTGLLGNDLAFTLVSSGRALASAGEWDLAALAFHNATQANPDYAEAWAFLGEAQQHLVDSPQPGDPLASLEKALALDPTSLSANSFLVLYWRRLGDYERALEHSKAVAAEYPTNPALQAELGASLAYSGIFEEALGAYQRAIELAPRDPAYYHYLVDFSLTYEYQVTQVALPAARQVLLIDPENPVSLTSMAGVLIVLGDLNNAQRFLDHALANDPLNALAHLNLGLVYIMHADRERAAQEWEFVISLAPNSPAAEKARRLLDYYFP